MKPDRLRTFGLLIALYLAQGLPFGFFTQALPVLLRQLDVSLEHIGLSSLLAAPWMLKFLWAPVVERTGTRRTWLLTLLCAASALMAALALFDPTVALMAVLFGVLLANFVAATQDIATDGLAISLLSMDDRGIGNGIQVAGYRVGMILGGGALLMVVEDLGWAWTMWTMAGLLLLCVLPLLAMPGVGAERVTRVAPRGLNPWDWIQLDGAWSWVAVLSAFKIGDYLGGGMLRPWLVDSGVGTAEIGALLGGGGFAAGLMGAIVGGALVAPLGRTRALVGFGALQATGVATYGLVAALDAGSTALWAAVVWEHFVGGLATAALFTAMMDASRLEDAGTDYTLQASIVVAASAVGAAASGFAGSALGYAPTFFLGSALAVAAPLLAAVPSMTRITRHAEG
jgi:predicted MFS family arabinose efflux permease